MPLIYFFYKDNHFWVKIRLFILDLIQAKQAWDITKGDPNIKVAIDEAPLDGIKVNNFDITHEDLAANIVYNHDPTPNEVSHGTFVAGCASAVTNNNKGISSIGFNTSLMLYRGADVNNWIHAVNNGARVLNFSFISCHYNSYQQTVINMLTEQGAIIVAGAGNGVHPPGTTDSDGNDISGRNRASCGIDGNGYGYPASYNNVLSISSVGEDNKHMNTSGAGRHTHNNKVDICAPGYNVLSTLPGNNYGRSSGTSFSAPITAGLIGLILSVNSCLDFEMVEYILKSTADVIADASSYPGLLGAGRINAYQAVLMATSYGVIAPITSNDIWSGDTFVKDDLVVEQGATLTITGTVRLSSGSRIIVKRGAKLIIDGGILTNTNGCNDFWQGVEVWGTSNKSQYPADYSYQGQLEIINGGIIENATVGIYVGRTNAQGTNMIGYEGGIVTMLNSSIINCKTAVVFNPYHNYFPAMPSMSRGNNSSFKNTTFETTFSPLWSEGNYPECFIKLKEVEGINISGCTFINNTPNDFSVYNRGKGVVAEDAYFYAGTYCPPMEYLPFPPCPNPIYTSFSNLYYAIDASKTWFDGVTSIKNITFNSNYRSIYLSNILNPVIEDNVFNIPDYDSDILAVLPSNNQPYGLYLNSSTGYKVENNSFNSSTSNKSTKHGIIVNFSGPDNNRLYNNTLSQLSVGIAAQGNNRGNNTGLLIKCNEFSNCNRDMSLAPYNVFYGVLGQYQGSPTEPAANLFSLAGTPFSDIYNESWTVIYYHNKPSSSNPRPIPVNYSSSVSLQNTNIAYNKSEQCPTSGGGGIIISSITSEIEELENTLSELVDGGNTTMLLENVANTPVWDALNLRNNLLNKSPYLSDTVLVSAVANEIVLPPSMLTQVLTANPHGIKSEDVKQSIENRQNAIPDYYISEIESGMNYISAKEVLESELFTMKNNRANEVNELIILLKQDSLNTFASDSICKLMSIEQTNKTVFNQYLRMLQFENNNANNKYLNILIDANDEDLLFLATLASDLKFNNKVLDSLSNDDYNNLIEIANNEESFGQGIARELLLNADIIEYMEPIHDINSVNLMSKKSIISQNISDNCELNVYPNPARDYIILYYKVEKSNSIIAIYDLRGKTYFSKNITEKEGEILIETNNFVSGSYFVKLQSEGKVIKTEKINIIK